MKEETTDKIYNYLITRIDTINDKVKSWTTDDKGDELSTRCAYLVLDKYINDYLKGNKETRWVAVPGLRGSGKTTLLLQLFKNLNCKKENKIFISVDEIKNVLGVSLGEILEVYEEKILKNKFERLSNPVFLFFDEVQYDEKWGVILKTIYDRTKNVFVMCTGSSSLLLQTNPDVARRIIFEKLYPLSFTEYMIIKERKFPITGLGNKIKEILFESNSAEQVFDKINKPEISKNLESYWKNINIVEISKYIKYGTLPFALKIPQETLIYDKTHQVLNNIFNRDIPELNAFDKTTISKIGQMLYLVASSDILSFNEISNIFSVDIKTVINIFDALTKTEMLIRVYPYGSHYAQARKASKFLFSSPSYRMVYFNLMSNINKFDEYKGKLLEDIVGLYLTRTLTSRGGSNLTYDSSKNGADFIIDINPVKNDRMIIEVGYGKKGFEQAEFSLKSKKGKYGLVISSSSLRLNQAKNCVAIPLRYFLLI